MIRGWFLGRAGIGVALAVLVPLIGFAQPAAGGCASDCNADGTVALSELITSVGIALGKISMVECVSADLDTDGRVAIDELIAGVAAVTNAYTSTWEGIQQRIIERNGCAQSICHGESVSGGLDLRPEVAYANLVDVTSMGSAYARIEPGEADRSFLWLKLALKTDACQEGRVDCGIPPGVPVPGAPMPQVGNAISDEDLELLRLWIYNGAPETGTVIGTEDLLGACLPPPEPITIKPLDPPAPGEGVQFVMPPWPLEAHSEHEVCFASYYDFSDQVPPQYLTPNGNSFYFEGEELRQDPQSHHLILNRYLGPDSDLSKLGPWSCRGGDLDGEECDPLDLDSCGEGLCAGRVEDTFACINFPPGSGFNRAQIGGAQQAQAFTEFYPGVYAQLPVRGILLWNSHAFNLTDQDHLMHARLNYYFADTRKFLADGIFNAERISAPNAPPYSTQTVCHDHTLPQYARLFSLSSHTHQRGKHFTVEVCEPPIPANERCDPEHSELIYESFVYNDPLNASYDPPLAFDSSRRADRTLHFCSFYNNGVGADDQPDPDTVTRHSRIPSSAAQTIGSCTPSACAAGKIGEPCNGVDDDAACDSSPGAGDGWCDACAITFGESTENEMFILIGQYFVDLPN